MKYEALLVDLDGTLYDSRPIVRQAWAGQPFDFAEDCYECEPKRQIIQFVRDAFDMGIEILVVTARYEEDRQRTAAFLEHLGVPWDELHMRPSGEGATDIAFKRDVVRTRVTSPKSTLALEDNPYIADMYQQFGVPVIQVPGWDFAPADPEALALPEVREL